MEVSHKDLQSAAKNINAVFELKPAIKTITSGPNLKKAIQDALAPAVAAADNRIDLLEEATINTYNILVQPDPLLEVAAELEEEDAQAEANLETVAAGEGDEECPVFGQEFDPSAPECTECARAEECAPLTQAKVKPSGKPKGRPKKTDEEKAAEKLAKEQAKIDKQAAKAAAKEARAETKEAKYTRNQATCEALQENINNPITINALVDSAHAKYMEHGGPDDRKVARRAADILLTGLLFLGHMTKNEDGTITYLG